MVDAVNTSIGAVTAISAVEARPAQERAAQRRDVLAARQAETERPKPLQAPFISPAIHVDVNYNKAVIQIRDSETGDVQETIPSESDLQRNARIEESRKKSTGDDISSSVKRADAAPDRSPQVIEPDVTAVSQVTAAEAGQNVQIQQATAEQVAAFEAAARSGDTNAGSISIFA